MEYDVSQELLEAIETQFSIGYGDEEFIRELLVKVQEGTATYEEANLFAESVGDLLADCYKQCLSSEVLPDGKMYYNIGKKVVEPTMTNNYNLISDYTMQVQTSLNEKAGLGIKAQQAPINQNKIDGIINRLSSADNFDDIKWILDEPIKNFSQSVVDDTLKRNADFQYKSGLKPKITRKTTWKCCKWCNNLAGAYSYPDVPDDIYRRHENCRCTVIYDPADGKRKVKDVHTKEWIDYKGYDRITNEPTKKELIERFKQGKIVNDNQWVIAEKIINGEYSLEYRHQKYLQHVKDTPAYNNVVKTRGKKQSYLTISEEEAQEIIYKNAGLGKLNITQNGKVKDSEFISVDRDIGYYYENDKEIKTSRVQIFYSKKGAHIVPVKEK